MIITKTIKPKVSVIITTYNRASLVIEAIKSVLAQTFKDFQLIVVDDGSTDDTRDMLKKYADSINYIYQENKGRAEARNTGIKVGRGEYVAFLDDDDIWLADKLEKQIAYLDSHPDIGLVHTFTEVIDRQGRLLEDETKKRFKFYKKAMKIGYTYEGMSRLCIMFMSTVILRKNCLDKVGLFDPDTDGFEDWDFYLRFALKYRIGTLPEPLARFRLHQGHTTMKEFIHGRIKTSMKNLALLNSCTTQPFRNRVCHNFYVHLANAYYINSKFGMFRFYILKALKLRPWVVFQFRLMLHLLFSMMPISIIQIIRRPSIYPERIIPEETSGGPLAGHLKRYDFVRDFCKDKVILDAACGVGYGAYYLSGVAKEVIGVDVCEKAIAYARGHYQKENVHFELMDIHTLKFPDKYFDIVCAFEALEHLDEPERFVSEVKRLLKKDGIFVVSTPQVKKTIYNPGNPYHKVEFSHRGFAELLKKYFRSVEIFGQKRLQSVFHYYLQKIDIFHLRAILPNFFRQLICHAVATRSLDEAGLDDFVISKEKIRRATELIGVCR